MTEVLEISKKNNEFYSTSGHSKTASRKLRGECIVGNLQSQNKKSVLDSIGNESCSPTRTTTAKNGC